MKKLLLPLLLLFFTAPIAWSCPSAADCAKSEMCKANQFYDKGDYQKAYSLYLKKANSDDVEAQAKIAEMFKAGKGVKQNDKKAFEWFKKAAIHGDTKNQSWSIYAQSYLGKMYMYGEGVKQNTLLGMYWWGKAADVGDAYSQDALANMYRNGRGSAIQDKYIQDVEIDAKKAIELYEKSAKQGNVDAQLNLARIYYEGKITNDYGGIYYAKEAIQDYGKAFAWYFKVAVQGNVEAQTRVGIMFDQGLGVDKDYKQAFNWYSVAADKNDALAQINLAYMYENGRGVDRDIKKAAYYYYLAALQGDVASIFKLYESFDKNVIKNIDKNSFIAERAKAYVIDRVRWYFYIDKFNATSRIRNGSFDAGSGMNNIYRLYFQFVEDRAKDGDAYTQAALAFMYKEGLGVSKNPKEEFSWYKKAADQNFSVAQTEIARKYDEGEGVGKNHEKAQAWYLKAADQGDKNAQLAIALGFWPACAHDFPIKDKVEAFKWFLIYMGSDTQTEDVTLCKESTSKLTPVERQQGKRLAKEWLAQHPQYKKNDQNTH